MARVGGEVMKTILYNDLVMSFTAKDGSTVTIRPAKASDATQIVATAKEIVSEGTFIQKEKVRTIDEEEAFINEMNEKDNMYVVIQLEDRVIGIARLIRGELEMKQHVGLFRTWLSKKGQGKGIGSKVMEYTLDWAEQHKLKKIVLTVFSKNIVAKKLYEKYGFIVEGVQKDQLCINREFQDEIYMAYFLK